MSIEMEIPKVLWLKNNMPKELFDRCKFYDLTDALEHIATGNEKRSFCSVVCKQGYVPVGVDGSVKGWQEDFLKEIGLEDLAEDNFKRMGGVNGVVSLFLSVLVQFLNSCEFLWSPLLCRQLKATNACLFSVIPEKELLTNISTRRLTERRVPLCR